MLYELNCTCGNSMQFMEHCFQRGLTPMVKVGCPACGIKFFIFAEVINVEELPYMIYDDWFKLTRWGIFSIRGNKKEKQADKGSAIQLSLFETE